MRAIITCGLYILKPPFEGQKRLFKHFVKNKHKKFTLSNPSKMISTQCVRAFAPSEYYMLLLVFKICFGGKVIHLSSCK